MFRVKYLGLFLLLLLQGCTEVKDIVCDDGTVCPFDKVCVPSMGFCAPIEEVLPCIDKDDNQECTLAGDVAAVCFQGICGGGECGDGVALWQRGM